MRIDIAGLCESNKSALDIRSIKEDVFFLDEDRYHNGYFFTDLDHKPKRFSYCSITNCGHICETDGESPLCCECEEGLEDWQCCEICLMREEVKIRETP